MRKLRNSTLLFKHTCAVTGFPPLLKAWRAYPTQHQYRGTSEITEAPEELSKDLVKAAETHAEDTGEPEMALGDLEAVIEVCIGLIPEAKRSALIEALAKQELLGGPKVLASEL